MPRSGTTLVEQIVSSHSLVNEAGELAILDQGLDLLNAMSSELSDHNMRNLHRTYCDSLRRFDTAELYVTDKMPLNFRWIGCILRAMPDAKITHVRRDARATYWSVFKHYFLPLEMAVRMIFTTSANIIKCTTTLWRFGTPDTRAACMISKTLI